MQKLLILGGFPQMIDIVFVCKAMGVFSVVADSNPLSPAKRFADESLDVSTDDIDALEDYCKKQKINGIFTGFEDFNIHNAQKLCDRLNLKFYATKEQLFKITDKLAFKDECRKAGVPVVEQYTYEQAQKDGKYPYIIKPADSYGSRGITICNNLEELMSGYEKAIETSKTSSAIIERFIDTDHGVELFYTVINGNIHLTVTADRYTVKTGETTVPLPVAEVFPSRHRNDMVSKLDRSIRQLLKNLEIKDGLVLIQALWDGAGEYYVYEMAYRFTGEQHYRLVEKQHGFGIAQLMIKYALGEDISAYDTELLDDVNFVKPSINFALILNPGKIDKISGLEKVYQIEEVTSYNLTHSEDDEVKASGDYSHMLIRINMVAKDYSGLCRAVKKVNNYVSVISKDGEDMLASRFELPEDV